MSADELSTYLSPILTERGSGYVRWGLLPSYPTLRAYVELLFDTPEFFVMFWNSVKIVFLSICGQLIVGIPAAWGFASYKFPLKKVLFIIYIAVMLMPFQVTMVSTYLALDAIHLMDTIWTVVLPAVFSTFPVFIMMKFFSGIPKALLEAAALDGANEFQIFLFIGLPLGFPGIVSALTLTFIENWNAIVWPQRFLNLGTRDNLQGRGCSVSTQLAYELFGSTHAAGLPFEFEDTVYSVQGVFEFSDPLLMIPVSPENDFLFDNLELFIRPGKEGGTIAQAFLRENGLDADAVVNGPELGAVLCLMSNLPVFFLWVSVFIALLWKLLKKQAQIQYQLETAGFLLLSLFLLFGTHTKIPASLIPTKWSDFSYWGRTALLYKERLMDLLSLNVTAKDLFFRMEFLALLVFLMLGMAVAGANMVSLAAWGNQFTRPCLKKRSSSAKSTEWQ